jgi:hypothetical protein
MLRIAATVAVLAAFPAAGLAARGTKLPAPGSPVAKVTSCDVVSTDRAATFVARMATVPGASKLQLRFQLMERLSRGTGWTRLDVPALGDWHTSAAGVNRFAWKQTVDNLHLGGAYKARVTYRWLTATGSVLSTVTRDSRACRGPQPNIAVGDLSVRSGPTRDTRTYRTTVSNAGKVDVDEVDVLLTVDKAELNTIALSHLAAGETRVVSFTGPLCRHGIRVSADPANTIGETSEGDNSRLFACP